MKNFDPDNLNEEICELLDLYVLGALEEDELTQVKNVLSISGAARNYVDESRSALALLEPDSPSDANLFDSIKEKINSTEASNVVQISSRSNSLKKYSYIAVAASILAVFLSISLLIATNAKNSDSVNMKSELNAFSKQEGIKKMALKGDGNVEVNLMMNDKGDVILDGRDMKSLSKNETYQLWALVEDSDSGMKAISASVLGHNPDISMTHVEGSVKGFAITKEKSGGVSASKNDPVYIYLVA